MNNIKPILFSGPMVRALLDGRKTQTRRILKKRATMPYQASDLLWVREPWRTETFEHDKIAPAKLSGHEKIIYEADADWSLNKSVGRLRPAIHMPRRASRITLEVTAVRVQRLREISWKDAEAEGCRGCLGPNPDFPDEWDPTPIEEFRDLWNALNAKPKPIYSEGRIVSYVSYPWDGESRVETYRGLPHEIRPNPFVIATTFVVHQMNIDEFLAQREAA